MKRFMTIMDSMTDKELDETSTKILSETSRLERWAKGSGCSLMEVQLLMEEYKRLAQVFTKTMKGMKLPKNMKGDLNPRNMQQSISQVSKMLPPEMLKMMGGPGAIQNMMKQMEGKF